MQGSNSGLGGSMDASLRWHDHRFKLTSSRYSEAARYGGKFSSRRRSLADRAPDRVDRGLHLVEGEGLGEDQGFMALGDDRLAVGIAGNDDPGHPRPDRPRLLEHFGPGQQGH